ncbi:hypothetical protein [Deinococcus sp.]|uniref:hypothetical protein n=1 Tax=Deinococcus sp. TaxID=47478 RepID=UPI0025FDB839|nr:hypothetical protein [Deinococcus sp.]
MSSRLIMSPWFLGALSAVFGLVSTLTPVKFYEQVLGEENLMFMNFKLYGIITSLVLLYILFAILGSKILFAKTKRDSENITKPETVGAQIGLIIVFSISLLSIGSILRTISLNEIIGAFTSGGGGSLRTNIGQAQSDARLGWTKDFSTFLLLYGVWIYFKSKSSDLTAMYRCIFFSTTASFILMTVLTLTRGPLINFLIMSAVIFISAKFSNRLIPIGKLFMVSLVGALLIIGFFFVVASARSVKTDSADTPIRAILGYFPASYNRAAYVIENKLHYPNEGGFYTLQGLINPPYIGKALDTYAEMRLFGLRVPRSDEEDWFSQFDAVRSAGLNQAYIWATTFGWAWADIGPWSYILFILYGFLSGVCFSLFRASTIFGIIFYPYIVCTISQWNAGLLIVQRSTTLAIVAIIIIQFIVKFLKEKRQYVSSTVGN